MRREKWKRRQKQRNALTGLADLAVSPIPSNGNRPAHPPPPPGSLPLAHFPWLGPPESPGRTADGPHTPAVLPIAKPAIDCCRSTLHPRRPQKALLHLSLQRNPANSTSPASSQLGDDASSRYAVKRLSAISSTEHCLGKIDGSSGRAPCCRPGPATPNCWAKNVPRPKLPMLC